MQDAGDEHRLAGREQLLEVELEADDEQQQDEADLGYRLDALPFADQAQADLRADEHARQKVCEKERLSQPVGRERQQRGDRDAQADARQQIGVLSHG